MYEDDDHKISMRDKLQALARLSAGVSHDFNNIISIVSGYATIMQNSLDKDDCDKVALQDYLDKMLTTCTRGAALTKKLQMFSRHRIIQSQTLDLAQIIKDNETFLSIDLLPSIILKVKAGEDQIPVKCAEDSIQQILSILVKNASDAITADSGSIIIEAMPQAKPSDSSTDPQFVVIRVSDTGCGMDPYVLEHMFDPFFTTAAHHHRSGLGLSIVHGLMNEMGGFIEVSSIVEQGTSIDLRFPLSDQPVVQKATIIANQDPENIDLTGYTGLVVDDEDDLVFIMRECLEEHGMNVLIAANGNEALMKLEDHPEPIDILLTDILMPELDGIRLGQMFGELSPKSKVIYMSGYPSVELASASYELPEKAFFLVKPVDQDELVKLVAQTLSCGGETPTVLENTAQWALNKNYSEDMK